MSKKAIARRCRNQKFIFAPAPPLLIIQEIFSPIFVFLCLLFTFIFILFCTLCWLPKKIFYLEHCFTPFCWLPKKAFYLWGRKLEELKLGKNFVRLHLMERRVTEEIIFAIKRRSKAQFLPPQDWVLISISD